MTVNMGVIYFTAKRGPAIDPFLCALDKRFSHTRIDVFTKQNDLITKLKTQHSSSGNIIILRAVSEETLIDIYFMCHHLRSLPSILILPDSEEHTVALGLRTKINFLFHRDSPIDDVMFVAGQFLDERKTVIPINGKRNKAHEDDYFGSPSHGGYRVSNL
jgi:hypothetical protein